MPHLNVTFEENIATIVLDRPPQNRIDDQMVDELAAAVTAIERSTARAVLVRSEAGLFFCEPFGSRMSLNQSFPENRAKSLSDKVTPHP